METRLNMETLAMVKPVTVLSGKDAVTVKFLWIVSVLTQGSGVSSSGFCGRRGATVIASPCIRADEDMHTPSV